MICSLWFCYHDGIIWAASHKNSFLVKQLRDKPQVAFEVSTNEYPYKGVRGKARVELTTNNADKVLATLKKNELGREAAIIGEVVAEHSGKAWLTTGIGGRRIIDMLAGEQLPRIC